MKIEFTVHSPVPLVLVVEVPNGTDAWRVLGILAEGQRYPVSHVVCGGTPPTDFPIMKVG